MYICIYIYMYIHIYIFLYQGGNHLSNTTLGLGGGHRRLALVHPGPEMGNNIYKISLVRFSLLRYIDSNFLGNSLWANGIPPLGA